MTGPTVLAIMAHPDDAELWAGGTLARHAQIGRAAIFVECASRIVPGSRGWRANIGAQLHATETCRGNLYRVDRAAERGRGHLPPLGRPASGSRKKRRS